MTGAELIRFATLVAVAVGVWLTLFYLFPLNARARFQYRATVLRDTCLDAVLDGRLRHTPSVDSFLVRADAMATRPEFFTLTRAWALHQAMAELRCDGVEAPTDASLKPEERQLLRRLEDKLLQAFVERLVRGSSFGWLWWLTSTLFRLVPRSKQRSTAVSEASPKHLAEEYSAMSERVPIKGHRLVSLSQ